MYSAVMPKKRNVISYANEKVDLYLKSQSPRDKKTRSPSAMAAKACLNLQLLSIQNYF